MWIRIFDSRNHWIRQIGIEHSIVRIIRLLGIRIEYLIIGMIGWIVMIRICGSGHSIVGIIRIIRLGGSELKIQ